MMNELFTQDQNKFLILLKFHGIEDSKKEMQSVSTLVLFLLRYPFLLNNASKTQNSRGLKTPQLNAPQGNIYMGARYLDPKYSRWISVDPALGEYVPGAGKANARDAGGLPGIGGVFNTVNLSLFHYAGNNPIRYVDPDGKFSICIGFQGQAGAGDAVTVESGVKIAFSWKKGFSFGIYSTERIGAEFGVSAFSGLVVTANIKEDEVVSGESKALVMGFSSEEIIGGGIEVSVDIDNLTSDLSLSKGLKGISLKIGAGVSPTVGEAHVMYSVTQTASGKDLYEAYIKPKLDPISKKFDKKITEINQEINDYYKEKMEQAYDY